MEGVLHFLKQVKIQLFSVSGSLDLILPFVWNSHRLVLHGYMKMLAVVATFSSVREVAEASFITLILFGVGLTHSGLPAL